MKNRKEFYEECSKKGMEGTWVDNFPLLRDACIGGIGTLFLGAKRAARHFQEQTGYNKL